MITSNNTYDSSEVPRMNQAIQDLGTPMWLLSYTNSVLLTPDMSITKELTELSTVPTAEWRRLAPLSGLVLNP